MSPSVTVRLLATQSDARLVELACQGHERAFEALVQRYRRPLLAYCRRVLLPEARAEDALQQALLQAWLALQGGAEVRDARAWLYRIVRNTALNALRGSGYDYAELSESLSGAHAPEEDLDRRIAVREALAGLAALPEQQREALLRTAVEGSSHADAAAEMGLSEGAVRGLIHRARVTLRAGVTAITPLPLASWAASAAGHGAGAATELALGGGSAGLVGLLAKGGAVAVTAGVLAVGVGKVEHDRHAHASPSTHTHAVRAADVTGPASATPIADAAPSGHDGPSTSHRHAGRPRLRRREPILAPAERERVPEVTVRSRDGRRGQDGGGEPPQHDMSGGDHDGRDGGAVTAPAPEPADNTRSGDDGGDDHSGSVAGESGDDGGSGSGSGDSGSDATSGSTSGDTGSDGGYADSSGSDSGEDAAYISGSASPR
jgi:RNA polymerase sigma factor (sigma-70 family)